MVHRGRPEGEHHVRLVIGTVVLGWIAVVLVLVLVLGLVVLGRGDVLAIVHVVVGVTYM